MPLTLLHGPAGSGKTKLCLRQIIDDWASFDDPNACYLIVPSPSAVDFYQKKIFEVSPNHTLLKGDVIVPFERFLLNLLKHNLPRLHQASNRFARNIIRKLLFEKNYPAFSASRQFNGIIFELASTFIHFKQNGLSPVPVHRIFQKHLTPLLNDLLRLFEDYNNTLEEHSYYDTGDLYAVALNLLRANRLKLPDRLKSIYVDRVFPLTLGQREIIKELVRAFPDLSLTVNYSYEYDTGDDRFLYPAYTFLGETASHSEYFNFTGSIPDATLHTFADPDAELRWVREQIMSRLAQGGSPDRIGVVLPSPPYYHRRLTDLLVEKNIPVDSPYVPPLAHHQSWTKDNVHQAIESFLNYPIPPLAQGLDALSALSDFEQAWDFEQKLLFSSLKNSPLLSQWREAELKHTRPHSPPVPGGIKLLRLNEAYFLDLDLLIVCGYVHGYYPAEMTEHPFYSSDILLDPSMIEILESPTYRFGVDKLRLAQIMARTKETIIFTRPQVLWDGAETAPSHLYRVTNEQVNMSGAHTGELDSDTPPSVYPPLIRDKFSISEIDTYLTCPYRYYARYHLKLGNAVRPETDIPPDMKGLFVHRVMQKLLQKHTDLYRDSAEYDVYLNRLIDQGRQIIESEMMTDASFGRVFPPVRESFAKRLAEVIAHLLREEIQLIRQKIKKTKPRYFEWPFGSGGTPPLKLKHQETEIFLTGRVDRIDVDDASGTFSVIDYKTGEASSGKSLKEGESIQLPVYMMATQKLLLKDFQPAGGFLLSLKDLSKKTGLIIEGNGEDEILKKTFRITPFEWTEITQKVTGRICEAVKQINSGIFAPKPTSLQECRTCDYRDICHYKAGDEDAGG